VEDQLTPAPQTPPLEIQPIPSSPFKKFLKLFIIVIVILVLIGGGGYFVANQGKHTVVTPTPTVAIKPTAAPTPIPTDNWQTYTNPQYGISVKYPPDYHVQEATYPDYGVFIASITNYTDQSVPFSSADKVNIDFAVAEKQQNNRNPLYYQCCAYGWIDYNLNALTPLANDAQVNGLTKIGTTTTAGVKTIIFKLLHENATGSLTSAALFAGFTKDTTGYLFHATSGQEDRIFDKETMALVDRIRSTFTFIPKQDASSSATVEGRACGGAVVAPCPTGYTCQLTTVGTGSSAETSGKCAKISQ
jgi:hypothetical protein